jgi:hypothetical protein
MIPDVQLPCKVQHSNSHASLHTIRPVNKYSTIDGFYAECAYCRAVQPVNLADLVHLTNKEVWLASESLQCQILTQAFVTEQILANKIKNEARRLKEDRTVVQMQDIQSFGSNIDWITKSGHF